MSDELPSEIVAPDIASVGDDEDAVVATDGPPVSATATDASATESSVESTITSASETSALEASTSTPVPTPAPTVKGLSPGQIAGITIGGVATALVVFFVLGSIFACLRRRKRDSPNSSHASPNSPSPRFGGLEKDSNGGDSLQTMASGRELPRLSAAYPKIVDPDKIGVAIGSPGQGGPSTNSQNRRGSAAMLIPKAPPPSYNEYAPRSKRLDREVTMRPESDITIINDLEDQPAENDRDISNPPPSRPPRPSFHIIPATPTQLAKPPPPAAIPAAPQQPPARLHIAPIPPPPTARQKPQFPTPLKLHSKRNNKSDNRDSTQSTNTIINEEPQTAGLPASQSRQSTNTIINEEPQTAGLPASQSRQSTNTIINEEPQTAALPTVQSRQSTATIINEEPQSPALDPTPLAPMVTVSESAAASRNAGEKGHIPSNYIQPMPSLGYSATNNAPYVPYSTMKSLPPPTYTSYKGVTTAAAAAPAAPRAVATATAPTKTTRSNTATSTNSAATSIETSRSRSSSTEGPTPRANSNKALTPVIESSPHHPQVWKPSLPDPGHPNGNSSARPGPEHARSSSSVSTTSSTLAEKRKGSDVPSSLKKGLWVTGSHGRTTAPISSNDNHAPAPAPSYTTTAPALPPAPVAWSTTVPISNYNAQKSAWPARSSSKKLNSRGSRLGQQVAQRSQSQSQFKGQGQARGQDQAQNPTSPPPRAAETQKPEMSMKSSSARSAWEPRLTPKRGDGGDSFIEVS
ncbi:MAG: hypothetical protein M1831_006971 [Alyxoria varia]|nr:MAG: hypothetical protein M1831_006971 [Alyxoria varia]